MGGSASAASLHDAAQVAEEVRKRVRIFGPGGGFVFNPIHNIQQGTPPENIVAAYDAAREEGVYPISARGR